jgi:predicted transcriptional regulator
MFKDEILENERRRRIYEIIEENPSIHLRELQRILNMPLATLEYHLSYMTRKKIIFSEADGHHKRYYTKPLDREEKKLLSALRQKRLREIVLIVLTNGKVKYQFLSDCLKLPHSTLSLYLKYLVDNEILTRTKIGYENLYTVQDEERIAKVLVAYRSSFLDSLVDKTLNTWMELHFRQQEDRFQ